MEILTSYSEVDISLDTWPYCGGNTVAESLWQGVPVLTLTGDRFSGRYGASILFAAGCPELVAENEDQLIEIAVELSGSLDRLEYYRSNLRRLAIEHGLSDPKKFAKKLDAAYISMLQKKWLGKTEQAR
jgi:predicted O-linked N-acetylglucosamine transferase (SPINDLY family)